LIDKQHQIWHQFSYIRKWIPTGSSFFNQNGYGMFKLYLKAAFIGLTRYKFFSAINIIGLAVSLTAFILMALYIEDEWSYDRFHRQASRIYRVVDDKKTDHVSIHSAASAGPIAPALLTDFPEVAAYCRLLNTSALVKYSSHLFEERNIYYTDKDIFRIFSFPLLKGDAVNALKAPQSVVLTEQMAAKYFGTEDPMGQELELQGQRMTVTGVANNVPANSHIQFDFLVSMSTAMQKESGFDWLFTNWYSNEFHTYLLLADDRAADQLRKQLASFDERHRAKDGTIHHYDLEKLTDIYLHSNRDEQIGKTGNINNLYIFSAIAVFILMLACINFISLSTARAAARAKEVAVKKVTGAARRQLIAQFFMESFCTTALGLVAAILLTNIVLPAFNHFAGKQLPLQLFTPVHIGTLLGVFIAVGLLSGTYPALILSGFKPAAALKGMIHIPVLDISVRKGLVVFQFAVSIILIICSIVIWQQLHFMKRHDLGFQPAQTMVINFEGDHTVKQQYNVIKQELLNIKGVRNVCASSNVPGDGHTGGWSMNFAKKNGDTIRTELPVYGTDLFFLQQYHIPVIYGRGLSSDYPADSTESILINETTLKKLGFASAADVLGVTVDMYPVMGRVVGVFHDFHFRSLREAIEPLAIRVLPAQFRVFSVEIASNNLQQTVADIETTWKQLVPERPLEYSFLNEGFDHQYEAETKFGNVFNVFSVLAIFIACLGLFGLALFSIRQRTKEIGIRKVLGAGAASIVLMLSMEFIKYIVIAAIIAAPLAWMAMQQWLQDFAYRVIVHWWVFVLAALIVLVIALITISFHAIKASMANPVKSLRTE
jgi:putative ABC transport system permease protein